MGIFELKKMRNPYIYIYIYSESWVSPTPSNGYTTSMTYWPTAEFVQGISASGATIICYTSSLFFGKNIFQEDEEEIELCLQ